MKYTNILVSSQFYSSRRKEFFRRFTRLLLKVKKCLNETDRLNGFNYKQGVYFVRLANFRNTYLYAEKNDLTLIYTFIYK